MFGFELDAVDQAVDRDYCRREHDTPTARTTKARSNELQRG